MRKLHGELCPAPVPRATSRPCPGLGFKYFQGWRPHTTSSGNLSHCLSSQYKSLFAFTRNLRSFILCPLASALLEGTTEKSLAPAGFLPNKYLLSCLLATPGLHWWLGLELPLFEYHTTLHKTLGTDVQLYFSPHHCPLLEAILHQLIRLRRPQKSG